MIVNKITPQDWLDALHQAALACNRAGIPVRVGQMYGSNCTQQVGMVIDGVKLVDGRLVIVGKEQAS